MAVISVLELPILDIAIVSVVGSTVKSSVVAVLELVLELVAISVLDGAIVPAVVSWTEELAGFLVYGSRL